MRMPSHASDLRSNRTAALGAGLLSLVAMATVTPKVTADDSDWRLARRGRELFLRDWRIRDPRCHGGDGLGPLYNASSCVACHGQGGPGGGGPASANVDLLNLSRFAGVSFSLGGQGQPQGLPQGRRGAASAPPPVVTLTRETVIDRLHPGLRDSASIVLHHFGTDLGYPSRHDALLSLMRPPQGAGSPSSPAPEGVDAEQAALIQQLRSSGFATITHRNPTPLFGIGLIDAIPDEAIYAVAAEAAADSKEPHGRIHQLKGGRIGRFGWKAQLGSLQEFVLTACANELGLENPGHHQAVKPSDPDSAARAPDLTGAECDALVAYVRDLPQPAVLDLGSTASESARAGRKVLESTGCTGCHRPTLGEADGIYSDLLLHEMGQSLSDSGQYYGDDSSSPGAPKSGEWRTPPLWGLRESAPYLHDGRAATVVQAIALHGGEAKESAQRFAALSIEQQLQLETFLKSLAAPGRPSELASRSRAAREEWSADLAVAEARIRNREWERLAKEGHAREVAERERIDREERRPDSKLQVARLTETNGRTKAALDLYRELLRDHPGTRAAREAKARIESLSK